MGAGSKLAIVLFATLVAALGCGRIGFESSGLSARDGSVDAATDGGRDAASDGGGTSVDGGPRADAGTVDGGALDASLPPCDESPCKLVAPQCGCASGLACQRPLGDDPLRACVAPGTVGPGGVCLANEDCTTAHVCVAAPGGTVGLCEAYCASSADCAEDTYCRELVVASEDIGSCATPCDPVANTGCPESFGCALGLTRDVPDRSFVDAPVCVASGPATGDPCPGYYCAGGNTCVSGTCRRVCDLAAPSCEGCTAFPSPVVVAGRELGTCP